MSKLSLDSALAAITNVPVMDLKQCTYRDLKWLVDMGRLCVRHQLPSGTTVPDGEQVDRSPHKSEWYLPNAEVQFIGSGLISKVGARLFYCSRLEGQFRVIDPGAGQALYPKSLNIQFHLGKTLLCLSVDKDAQPWKLFLGRLTDKELNKPTQFVDHLESEFGLRCIYLHVPIMEISSFKEASRAGHCRIDFMNARDTTVTDLGSTNSTLIKSDVKPEYVEQTRIALKQQFIKQKTTDMHDICGNFIKLPQQSALQITPPFEIDCAGRIKLLVYET